MKANEAPEKIYIDTNEAWYRTYTAFIEKAKGNDIEYTRTDAFIEKATQWLKENLLNHTYIYEGEVGIGMAVFLEDFKKAMT